MKRKLFKIIIVILAGILIFVSCFAFPKTNLKAYYKEPEYYQDNNYFVYTGIAGGDTLTFIAYQYNQFQEPIFTSISDVIFRDNNTDIIMNDTNVYVYLSVGDTLAMHFDDNLKWVITKRYNKEFIGGHTYLVLDSDLFAYYFLDLTYNRIIYYDFEDDTFDNYVLEINNNAYGESYEYKTGNMYNYDATNKRLNLINGYALMGGNAYEIGYEVGYNEGYAAGRIIGYDIGYNEGYAAAYQDGYTAGQTNGYQTGYNAGEHDGRISGYNEGLAEGIETGYNQGYQAGYNAGLAVEVNSLNHNWIISIFSTIGTILGIKLFGDITIGVIIGVPIVLLLVLFVLKLIRGNG